MRRKFDVVAVGMINFDINVKNFDPGALNRKVQEVDQIALSFGGDAQNCAATMARLGLKTAICGAVGNDIAGDLCIGYEKSAGIDTSMVCRKPSQSGTAIQLFQTAEAHVLDCNGANRELETCDIPEELYGSSRIVSLHSFFNCGRIGAEFLERAQSAGAVTLADTTSLLPGDGIEDIREALKYLDYFVPSISEAQELTGVSEPARMAEVFMDCGVKNVVIKAGERGCYVRTSDIDAMVAGYPVKNLVDTTGCGDNFVAGFITGLAKDLAVIDCARLANAAGAINAAWLGSNGAVQSYEQLLRFIWENEEK